jgi:hypothetical protein
LKVNSTKAKSQGETNMIKYFIHYKPTKSTMEVKSKQDVLKFVLSEGIYNLDFLDNLKECNDVEDTFKVVDNALDGFSLEIVEESEE